VPSLQSTIEAKAWLTSLACRKAKELGYPHELWTTRLLVIVGPLPGRGRSSSAAIAPSTTARSTRR
jgi:hypothetical protein